jgi:predicted transcriptional regulator
MSRQSPVRDRLLDLLRQHHRDAGITTAEIATRMNRSTVAMSTMLGRLRMYGIVVKTTDNTLPHELNRWSLPEC